MITFCQTPGLSPLCSITQDPAARKVKPVTSFFPLGHLILNCLDKMERDFPQLKVLCRVIMPDHIHFEVWVREYIEKHLGTILGIFSTNCSQRMRSLLRNPGSIDGAWRSYFQPSFDLFAQDPELSLFIPGFNDKIVRTPGAKDAFYNYILDNPRRYLVKKLHPEFFCNQFDLELNGRRYALYGNFFLLDNPVKSAVKISRNKAKMPDLPERIREWEETIRCGGVLVSPFINPEEKRFRDMAAEGSAGIILVVNYTFSERWKPHKTLFELCQQGRLLFVSTGRYDTEPNRVTYEEAHAMNDIALQVASLQSGGYRLLPRQKR